ncbi:hypothetical protein ACIOJE_40760 [Kitasatospora sp. NPDC087861]
MSDDDLQDWERVCALADRWLADPETARFGAALYAAMNGDPEHVSEV